MSKHVKLQQIRAKFQVTRISENYWRDASGTVQHGSFDIYLTPQYDDSIEKDRCFAKATPSGEIRLTVTNELARQFLRPGHNFYVDFTEVD